MYHVVHLDADIGIVRVELRKRLCSVWSKWAGEIVAAGHGPLARYLRLRVVHAPGMPGTFASRVSDPDMHHGTCVMSGSLTSSFL